MDWYPLWNSLRIAAIACVIVFFSGIALAYYVARLPRILKGILDVVLTLPLAREFSRYGIRVVTIAPGLFETPMLMALPQEARDSLGASVPFPARLAVRWNSPAWPRPSSATRC